MGGAARSASLRGKPWLSAAALALGAAVLGCGAPSSSADPKGTYSGRFGVELRSFLDGPTSTTGPRAIPENLYVSGQIYDGPFPENVVATALAAPADATPGCAVYKVAPPSCVDIGGCGAQSQDRPCAAAASTGSPCTCVDTDTCQRFPRRVSAGDVTVTGVTDTQGATSLRLKNLSNSYQVPDGTTLAYPGFGEGDLISVSATGAGCPAFTVSAKGVAPLSFTREAYALTKDPASDSPTRYRAFDVQWAAPASAGDTQIHLELDISHHGGTVGYLACDVERTTSSAVQVGAGEVELEVISAKEFVLTIDGYTSCLSDTDCSDGQVCNRTNKLCRTP
jgi:hypothetical protein